MELLTPSTLGYVQTRGRICRPVINCGKNNQFKITESGITRIGGTVNPLPCLSFAFHDGNLHVAITPDGFSLKAYKHSVNDAVTYCFSSTSLRSYITEKLDVTGNFSLNILPEKIHLPKSSADWYRLELKKKEA